MRHRLAQINVAKFRVPMTHPVNADFGDSLERVDAAAGRQPGFGWRLVGEGGNATDIRAYEGPNILENMSVWTDVEALSAFVYRDPSHREIMRRRREWFERLDFFMALWRITAGHRPTVAEGKSRLELLSQQGPSEHAFLFTRPFGPGGATGVAPTLERCA